MGEEGEGEREAKGRGGGLESAITCYYGGSGRGGGVCLDDYRILEACV